MKFACYRINFGVMGLGLIHFYYNFVIIIFIPPLIYLGVSVFLYVTVSSISVLYFEYRQNSC